MHNAHTVIVVAHPYIFGDQALRNSATSLGQCQQSAGMKLVRFIEHSNK